ncbi:MAG: LysR substrate-binding domain-containing protein [Pseudomonadota bacterium]
MNWTEIPSLMSLRAFEVAARLKNLSAAASELNVTHAAVAQHIRALEDYYSTALMKRQGRGMALTQEGAELSLELSDAFAQIGSASRKLLEQHRNRAIRVTTTQSLAAGWLMPQIGEFWRLYPDIDLEIIPNNDVVDMRESNMDVAIRYGVGNWPGLTATPLISAGYIALAKPDMPTDTKDLTRQMFFLSVVHISEASEWLKSQGIVVDSTQKVPTSDHLLSLQAAIGGRGVAIVPRPYGVEEVITGKLKIVLEDTVTSLFYHVVTRPDVVNANRDTFVRWLKTGSKIDPQHAVRKR